MFKQFALCALLLTTLGAGCAQMPEPTPSPTETPDIMMNALYEEVSDKVVTEDVVTETHRGFVAQPKEAGSYPGVVMIHEWWGLNDNIKQMARQLAARGYVVYAVDLYGGEVATESSDAQRLAGSVRSNPAGAVALMKAAVAYLRDEKNVGKVGSLGWCFGGQQSLNLSLAEDLDATVIYYGNLATTTAALTDISGPVLGIFGSTDTSVPVADVALFEKALKELNVENTIHIYDGVGHAFANPSGSRYAETEAVDAWNKTVEFLSNSLQMERGQ